MNVTDKKTTLEIGGLPFTHEVNGLEASITCARPKCSWWRETTLRRNAATDLPPVLAEGAKEHANVHVEEDADITTLEAARVTLENIRNPRVRRPARFFPLGDAYQDRVAEAAAVRVSDDSVLVTRSGLRVRVAPDGSLEIRFSEPRFSRGLLAVLPESGNTVRVCITNVPTLEEN